MRYVFRPDVRAVWFCLSVLLLGCVACAQVSTGHTMDETVPPGANYDKAEFRLWYSDDAKTFRAILVLVPGANADGRSDVGDPSWQAFASRNDVAIVGCRFTDKPHDEALVEKGAVRCYRSFFQACEPSGTCECTTPVMGNVSRRRVQLRIHCLET
jgi:hypothetical protein